MERKLIKYQLDKMNTLELFGSLSMTELGHGSNVAEIETKATYDSQEQVFIINSPTESSQKVCQL